MFFYITKDETPELMVMLNSFNFVQFAHARHSSSKLGSALAQSQISASHREPFLVFLRGQILKFAIKREQSQACLNYAEREQIEQR